MRRAAASTYLIAYDARRPELLEACRRWLVGRGARRLAGNTWLLESDDAWLPREIALDALEDLDDTKGLAMVVVEVRCGTTVGLPEPPLGEIWDVTD